MICSRMISLRVCKIVISQLHRHWYLHILSSDETGDLSIFGRLMLGIIIPTFGAKLRNKRYSWYSTAIMFTFNFFFTFYTEVVRLSAEDWSDSLSRSSVATIFYDDMH